MLYVNMHTLRTHPIAIYNVFVFPSAGKVIKSVGRCCAVRVSRVEACFIKEVRIARSCAVRCILIFFFPYRVMEDCDSIMRIAMLDDELDRVLQPRVSRFECGTERCPVQLHSPTYTYTAVVQHLAIKFASNMC